MITGHKCWLWSGLSTFSKVEPSTIVPGNNGFNIYGRTGELIIDGSIPSNFTIRQQAENIILRRIDKQNIFNEKPRLSLSFLNVYGDRVARDPEGIDCSKAESTGVEVLTAGLASSSPAGAVIATPAVIGMLKKQSQQAQVSSIVYNHLCSSGCIGLGETANLKSQMTVLFMALALIALTTGLFMLLAIIGVDIIITMTLFMLVVFLGVYGINRYISR